MLEFVAWKTFVTSVFRELGHHIRARVKRFRVEHVLPEHIVPAEKPTLLYLFLSLVDSILHVGTA